MAVLLHRNILGAVFMQDRIAVVTGGIGGLGIEICRELAAAGCRVVAADLGGREERIAAFRAATSDLGDRLSFAAVDVASFESCESLVRVVESNFGPISILVNGAGITRDTTLRKMSRDQWDAVMTVNLDGVFNMCRQVVGPMADRGHGRIVNISSVNGQTGQFGQVNYSAAKAGMHGFTMALAREVARKGVTCNSISPGYCRTDLVMTIPEDIRRDIVARIPVGRMGEPSDIARVVAFLAADSAGFITGANIPVNGGYFMDF
jgi:acetoacetyl-CoA reductase